MGYISQTGSTTEGIQDICEMKILNGTLLWKLLYGTNYSAKCQRRNQFIGDIFVKQSLPWEKNMVYTKSAVMKT